LGSLGYESYHSFVCIFDCTIAFKTNRPLRPWKPKTTLRQLLRLTWTMKITICWLQKVTFFVSEALTLDLCSGIWCATLCISIVTRVSCRPLWRCIESDLPWETGTYGQREECLGTLNSELCRANVGYAFASVFFRHSHILYEASIRPSLCVTYSYGCRDYSSNSSSRGSRGAGARGT